MALAAGCADAFAGDAPERRPLHPVLLLGVDGLEWSVIDALQAKGELPAIAALRARGASGPLTTDYGAASPVVWTTIATGRDPEDHGITTFVVGEGYAARPVSSTMRKVPAIWNVASAAGRRVMVLGWWGSWPAEPVNGLVVSDRALKRIEHAVSPSSWLAAFQAEAAIVDADRSLYPTDPDAGALDRLVSGLYPRHAAEVDLAVGYLHGTDHAQHQYWRYWRPEDFSVPTDPARVRALKDAIPEKYRAVDGAIARIVAAAPDANLLVVSDHGFGPLPAPSRRVSTDLDALLVALDLQVRTADGLDRVRSVAYTADSAPMMQRKWVRFGGAAPDSASANARLTNALRSCTWEAGEAAFRVTAPANARESAKCDVAVDVLTEGAGPVVICNGTRLRTVVKTIVEHSGGHGWEPPGVFIAAGPDIDPTASLAGLHVRDIAPTVLYGLGLPLADDLDGTAREGLFRPAFRNAWPRKRVATYGALGEGVATRSETTDNEMVEELRALGYLP